MMQVPGAENDGIHVCGRTVLERARDITDLLQQRDFFDVVWPLLANRRSSSVRDSDRLAAVFPALRGDVLHRDGRPDD